MSASTSPQNQQSSKASRRANSCKPCRDSKSKCSGGIPCTTCQKKRRKPRCFYSNSISQDGEDDESIPATSEKLSHAEPRPIDAQPEAIVKSEVSIVEQVHGVVGPHEDFYGTFSLACSVEEFKQLSPLDGQFQEIIDSIQPIQLFDLESVRASTVPTNLPARPGQRGMDSISHLSPLLQRLYSKYYSVQSLMNEGLVTKAWSKFASLIRDSELFGLKEYATLQITSDAEIDPEPSRQLWWLLIELDVQLSFLLGRRPCIDRSHGVPKPITATSREESKDSRDDVLDYTEFMIETLNTTHQRQNNTHSSTHDLEAGSARLQSTLGQLQQLCSKLPLLPRDGLEDASLSALAQHQIDFHLGLMVLSCQTLRSLIPENEKLGRLRKRRSATKVFHNELLKSLRTIIDVFDYSHKLDPAMAASSWPRCFGVLSAALILGIIQLQQLVNMEPDKERLETALKIFASFAANGQAAGIAQLAADSFGEILEGINELKQQTDSNTGAFAAPSLPNETTTSSDGLAHSAIARATRPTPRVRTDGPTPKRSNTSNLEEGSRARKRLKSEEEPTAYESLGEPSASTWSSGYHQDTPSVPMGHVYDVVPWGIAHSQSLEQESYPHSAATSFNSQVEFQEELNVPAHSQSFADYRIPEHWFHPPLKYHPPLYDPFIHPQFQVGEHFMPDVISQSTYHHSSIPSPANQAHVFGDVMQNSQRPTFVHVQQTSPTHSQGLMMLNAQNMHSIGSTPVLTRAPTIPLQVQEYNARAGNIHEHTMSSPNESSGQAEVSFTRPPGLDRRRSLADTRQLQMSAWTPEVLANVSQQQAFERGHGQKRRLSPPRPAVPSPVNDTTFQQGDTMTMEQSQSLQNRSMPATRRRSTTHLDGPSVQARPDHLTQKQYAGAQQVQSSYDPNPHAPYAITMVDEGLPDFGHSMQYHPNVAVTTGPYTDGQSHRWGWTG